MSDFDALKELAGSYWSKYGGTTSDAVVCANSFLDEQLQAHRHELESCVSRHTTPIASTVFCHPLYLRKSEGFRTSWAIPPDLLFTPYATDKILKPDVALIYGTDFVLHDGAMVFAEDPFKNDALRIESNFDTYGNKTDETLVLWLHEAEFDKRYLDKFYGTLFDLSAQSSTEYKGALEYLYACILSGSTEARLKHLLARLFCCRLAENDESVTDILLQDMTHVVITDKAVYKSNYMPVVKVGQKLQSGDSVFDDISFVENHANLECRIKSRKKLLPDVVGKEMLRKVWPLNTALTLVTSDGTL